MWMWIYCLLATIYFLYFKDYLIFIRDLAYRNIIWNTQNITQLDIGAMNEFLEKNYNKTAQIASKVFFVFISPIYLIYVLFYIIKRLDF